MPTAARRNARAPKEFTSSFLVVTETFERLWSLKGRPALVGAIVLEDLDLLVDCVAQQVVPAIPVAKPLK